MKTIEEIKKAIDENRTKKFYLDMKDRWSDEDYTKSSKLNAEYLTLVEELKAMGGSIEE